MNFPVLSTPRGKRQCPPLVRESTLLTFRVGDVRWSEVSFCSKRFWGPARTTGWVSTAWCCSLSTCLICSPLNMRRSQVHAAPNAFLSHQRKEGGPSRELLLQWTVLACPTQTAIPHQGPEATFSKLGAGETPGGKQ